MQPVPMTVLMHHGASTVVIAAMEMRMHGGTERGRALVAAPALLMVSGMVPGTGTAAPMGMDSVLASKVASERAFAMVSNLDAWRPTMLHMMIGRGAVATEY